MKKLLILLTIFSITTTVFAQVTLEPKIEVNAEAIVGADLDGPNATVGFKTSAEATVSLTFREEASEEFGEGRIYGWINLKDLKIELKSSHGDGKKDDNKDPEKAIFTWGDIEARINFGPTVYLNLRKSDREVNKASRSDVITKGMFHDGTFLKDLDTVNGSPGFNQDLGISTQPDGVGVALGFNVLDGNLNIEAGLASDRTFDDALYDNEMVVSLKAEHKTIPDALTLSVTSVNVLNRMKLAGGNYNYYSVGIKVDPSFGMGDFKFSIPLGVDLVLGQVEDELLFNYEVGGGLKYTWASRGTDGDGKNISFFDADADVTSGFSIGAAYVSHSFDTSNKYITPATASTSKVYNMNTKRETPLSAITAQLSFYEDSGDEGLVPILGGVMVTSLQYFLGGQWADAASEDLDGRMDLGVGSHTDVDLGIVKLFFGTFFQWADVTDTLKDAEAKRQTLGVKAGIELKELVDNTTFTLAYASGDLLNEDAEASRGDNLYNAWKVSASKVGQVTLGVKVSF